MADNRRRDLRTGVFIGITAVLSLLLGLGLAAWLDGGFSAGTKYPGIGGDFTLTSSRGQVSLRDFRGKVVVIYFGYASCPDVCPTALSTIAAAIGKLDAQQRQQVLPLFISVDPKRDTPQLLAEYTRAFYPGMIGLTGSKEQIDAVTGQYKAFYALVPQEGGEYLVDHTSATYVVGRDGELRDILNHATTAQELAVKLRATLES